MSEQPATLPPVSPDGHWWWDGRIWQPVGQNPPGPAGLQDPQPALPIPAVAPRRHTRGELGLMIGVSGLGVAVGLGLIAAVATGALHLNLRPQLSGAGSVNELSKESAYNTVYGRDATQVRVDSAPYAATASSPGVCNKGGNAQGCYNADQKVAGDLRTMSRDLSTVSIPPRFARGDGLLKQALEADIEGLNLRDQALTSGNPNASLAPSNAKLQEAVDLLNQAYAAYPADNRPQPSLI